MDSSVEHVFSVEAMVRGYHEYQSVWAAPIGEMLICEREVGNFRDTFAVAIKKDGEVVGHCPRKISALCSIFIRRGGKIACQVTGRRRYSSDLPQGGLEVPCKLTFYTRNKSEADKTEKLIKNSLSKAIADAITAVDARISNLPATSTSAPQYVSTDVSTSISLTSINLDDDVEQPAKKQKTGNKEVEEIIMGNELSDLHINMAQNLLKAQFPEFNGFRSTLLQEKELPVQSTDDVKNKVQIIHCNKRHHWIVATTVKYENSQVLVIDSLYKSLDDETKGTVCRLFQSKIPPVIKVVNPQRQKGDKDCGLFAIAFATAIAFGENPVKKRFKQQSMRIHLAACFQQNKITPFP